MVEVYSSSDSATVGLLQGVLESEGIQTFFRNENLSTTEVMIPAFYPTLCVMNPDHEKRARELIERALGENVQESAQARSPWKCTECDEENPGGFELCWSCQVPLEKSS